MIAAYHGLLSVAQLNGDSELLSSSVEGALALDPADHWIYDGWMSAVEVRWGGSEADMDGVLHRALRHANENPLLRRMEARQVCEQAEMTNCVDCGTGKDRERAALELYRKAATYGPVVCFLNYAADTAQRMGGDDESVVRYNSQAFRFLGGSDHLIRRSWALHLMGRPDLGLKSLDIVLKQQPNNIEALKYQGWMYLEQHSIEDAEKSFSRILEIDPSNREGTTELVRLYVEDLNERDKAQQIVTRLMTENPNNARAWLLQWVLDKGIDDAKSRDDLEKYLSMVIADPNDSYGQQDIARAKAQLAALNAKVKH